MHIFVLVMIAFWIAQPATATAPAQAESIHIATAVLSSEADCEMLGNVTASQVQQSQGVSHVAFACIEATNPKDKLS